VDLTRSDEQVMLADTAAAFVARECPPARVRSIEATGDWHDTDLWRAMAGLGWPALALPTEHGGAGQGLLEVAVLAEQLGRGPLPSPLLVSTTLAALPVVWAGSDDQRAGLLAPLANGERIGTLALVEPAMTDLWSEPTTVGNLALCGKKLVVPWAGVADVMVVATAAGPWLVEPDRGGVRCARHDAFAGDPLYAVTFEDAPAEPLGGPQHPAGPDVTRRCLDAAAIAQLAYAVGAAEACLALSVRHACERVQFGRPIGAFQAVAHRCVDMRTDIDACRYLAYQAAWAVDDNRDAALPVTAALSYATDALRRVFLHAHQVHGASGFSTEQDLHLFTRRLEAFDVSYASAACHRDRLATAMGLA
jgi:alkylation response protein AidB-like acyl-CoA dehydrogenase